MATQKGKGATRTAPLSARAPRIMVTESNEAVAWQVDAAGGLSVASTWNIRDSISQLALCDGLLITGGGDVNPALYGQERHRSVYGLTTGRDLRELALLGAARTLGIPVFGICRGLQIMAVEAGGSLYQNIPDEVGNDDHSYSMMPVATTRDSLVGRALGAKPTMLHLHHQAVRVMPKGFRVTARHEDGTVEAMESFDGRAIGVQFHPESFLAACKSPQRGWKLFDAFVSACDRSRRRAKAKPRPALLPVETYLDAWPVAVAAHDAPRPSVFVSAVPKAESHGTTPPKKGASLKQPVAYCACHGYAFDSQRDYADHRDWFEARV